MPGIMERVTKLACGGVRLPLLSGCQAKPPPKPRLPKRTHQRRQWFTRKPMAEGVPTSGPWSGLAVSVEAEKLLSAL